MGEDFSVLQLWRACYAGNTEHVQELIDDDVDFCQRDRNGETVLHMAARSDNCEVLNILLNHLSPDVHNHNHQTSLHLAAMKGHINAVNLLLQADCQLDLKTKYSEMTALHLACQHGRSQVVEALLEGGAICNLPDTIGKPPKFYATEPDILRLLAEHDKHCTHKQPHSNPLVNTDEEDGDENDEASDEEDGPEKKKGARKMNERARYLWQKTATSSKKIKINHGLGFSDEHKRRMEMNVFDRLLGNKKK